MNSMEDRGDRGQTGHTLVVGVGNRCRGDDGAGPYLADLLRERGLPNVEIVEHSGEGASLMELWRSFDKVILLDAVSFNGKPGSIYRLDPREQGISSHFFNYSTHAFSIGEAIEMARVLGTLPDHLIVFGIEGHCFDAGADLSPKVGRAAQSLVTRIHEEIIRLELAEAV